MVSPTDPLGGSGNGIAWYADASADITNHPIYQTISQTTIENINLAGVQNLLKASLASADSAPIVNYLCWVIRTLQLSTWSP